VTRRVWCSSSVCNQHERPLSTRRCILSHCVNNSIYKKLNTTSIRSTIISTTKSTKTTALRVSTTSQKKTLTTKPLPTTIGLQKTSVTTKSTTTLASTQKISSTKKELPTTTTKKYHIETTIKSPRRGG
jgi:hypothetical protein